MEKNVNFGNLKIVVISDFYPPFGKGGGGQSTHILSLALKFLGNNVLVITSSSRNKTDIKGNYEGIEIRYVNTKVLRKFRNIFILYNHKAIKEIEKILFDYKPDIIHIHNVSPFIPFYSLVVAKKYAKKVFFTARDVLSIAYEKYWWFIDQNNLNIQKDFNYKIHWIDLIKQAKKAYVPGRNFLVRHILNNYCTKIFAVSKELKKAMMANGIKNIDVVYNSVDVKDYDEIDDREINNFKIQHRMLDKKIIFYGGRLNVLKGLVSVLKAFARVREMMPDVILALAGVNFDQNTEKMIKHLRIENNIINLGWLDKKEMAVAYRSCDLVLMPSLCLDCFPRINLEAFAAKKPVVGTCFGGTPEIIEDGVNGYIVNPLNIDLMSERVIDILSDPDKMRKFGEAGYKKVKNDFNPEKQAKITLEYYKNE